jgi:hypothetical protein
MALSEPVGTMCSAYHAPSELTACVVALPPVCTGGYSYMALSEPIGTMCSVCHAPSELTACVVVFKSRECGEMLITPGANRGKMSVYESKP